MVGTAVGGLFNRKVLAGGLQGFRFPEDLAERQGVALRWGEALRSGRLAQMKEVSLHGDFLKDIFQTVLGYGSVVAGDRWELHAEKTIADRGGSADGAIGLFHAKAGASGRVRLQGRVVAPIELKGATNELDRVAAGRGESAVDQGWRHANYTPDCRWVIVSNYREIRLYETTKTPAYYE